MNCQHYQESLVAYLEGALPPELAAACKEHLDACPACRSEQQAIAALRGRLVRQGQLARPKPFFVAGVMNHIQQKQAEKEQYMRLVKTVLRWALPCGTAAAGLALAAALYLGSSPKSAATALQVMERGAKATAKVNSLHLACRARTGPADNFMNLSATLDFTQLDLWKEFSGARRWRIEKPGRVVVMDGQSTLMLTKPSHAIKVQPTRAAFDTTWLHEIANLSQTIEAELRKAKAQGWPMQVRQENPPGAAPQAVVTIDAKCGLPDSDYLKNKFFNTADTRRVYRFNDQSERLEGVEVYLQTQAGEVLVFQITQIQYDPAFAASVFTLDLPQDVSWFQPMEKVANNDKYVAMTAQQAARTFFEACAREDWQEVGLFQHRAVDQRFKDGLGGLTLVSLGQPFTSQATDASFVPYEIKLKNGQTRKWNLALKKDPRAQRWFIDGGL